jgi:hypothetical protein
MRPKFRRKAAAAGNHHIQSPRADPAIGPIKACLLILTRVCPIILTRVYPASRRDQVRGQDFRLTRSHPAVSRQGQAKGQGSRLIRLHPEARNQAIQSRPAVNLDIRSRPAVNRRTQSARLLRLTRARQNRSRQLLNPRSDFSFEGAYRLSSIPVVVGNSPAIGLLQIVPLGHVFDQSVKLAQLLLKPCV